MEYKGLERVKQQFLDIKSKIDICKEQGRDLSSERFSIVFQGNPGTGKTTVANLYGRFLESLNVFQIDDWSHEAISGIEMVTQGLNETERKIKEMIEDQGKGGVLIIDEAYQLISPQAGLAGQSTLDIILTMMETHSHKLAIVFLGYREEMETFFEHNPGLSSRIPYVIDFDDFTEYELWKILCKNITDQYHGKMKVEGGMDGLYMRCITRRLSASRGKKGFGNARTAQNLLAIVTQRQARRLVKERRDGKNPNCFLLTKEDLIGPNPSKAIRVSQAWRELQNLVGLEQVKESVQCMVGSIEINYERELHEFRPIAFSLNQVFIGEPGTGKTTVARLYGRILADLGYLSRGDVILKTPADFVGDFLGKSEAQTRRILDASVGKMKTMFRNANPGLSRRFPIEQPFRFKSFAIEQLMAILRSKMTDQDLNYSDDALTAAYEIFKRDMRGNSTNVGIVDHALETAKLNYSRRLSNTPFNPQNPNPTFEAADFNLDLSRNARFNCREMMKGQIDDAIIDQLEGYQKRHWKAKELDISLEDIDAIPTRFLFHGPPGTGKTTTARLMAKLFFEMGYLSMPEVVEYSATDFVGQYVGHTGHKTQEKLKDAVGRLVFIDDISRLLDGAYEAKAIEELIQFLSQPAYQRNIVVILSGDKGSIDELTNSPGVSSVFSEEIAFKNIPPKDCLKLLNRELGSSGLAGKAGFAKDPWSLGYDEAIQLFYDMQSAPSWANARDVGHLARQIRGKLLELDNLDTEQLEAKLSEIVISCMNAKIVEQKARYNKAVTGRISALMQDPSNESKQDPPPVITTTFSPGLQPKHRIDTDIKVDTSSSARENAGHIEPSAAETTEVRLDTSQPQVQTQKRAREDVVSKREGVSGAVRDQVQKAKAAFSKYQARLKGIGRKRQGPADAVLRKPGKVQERAKVQDALKKLGPCEYGFLWTREGEGYRCKGGQHFVSDAEVHRLVGTEA
ncbi:P-loop containing nucleoside triphosphate hydrolase protein [Nemania abortiva]|nr:P-loop containing nucleoside triphosphate hydrolase protein [Nemania abortiva]